MNFEDKYKKEHSEFLSTDIKWPVVKLNTEVSVKLYYNFEKYIYSICYYLPSALTQVPLYFYSDLVRQVEIVIEKASGYEVIQEYKGKKISSKDLNFSKKMYFYCDFSLSEGIKRSLSLLGKEKKLLVQVRDHSYSFKAPNPKKKKVGIPKEIYKTGLSEKNKKENETKNGNVKKTIEAMQEIENAESCDQEKLFSVIFRGLIVEAPIIKVGEYFFRGRPCRGGEEFKSLTNFKSPPKGAAAQGRCNEKGESVFYCSNSRRVPFFECDLSPGDHFLLSKWKIKKELVFNIVGYTDEVFSKLKSSRQPGAKSSIISSNPNLNAVVQEWLARLFTAVVQGEEREKIYTLTNQIFTKLIDKRFMAGLMYPTVRMMANADNFAVLPAVVDNHLDWVWTKRYVFKGRVDDSITREEIDFANSVHDGEVVWKGRKSQLPKLIKKNDSIQMVAEDDEWVAYAADGSVIEPY